MSALFSIVGHNFFSPLSSKLKNVYFDCLNIIYDSYRTELSFGCDREILVKKLIEYFDTKATNSIQFDNEDKMCVDSRDKATSIIRNLKEYGWIEYEIANDQSQKIIMPSHAVTILQTLNNVANNKEMEYQSEISAIYSLLTNEELLNRPYPQVLKPVYERTLSLFTGLKQLNTSIKKYIQDITSDKTSEEIIEDFFKYNDEIGSKAYHRIKTNDNVVRFRRTIINSLKQIRENETILNNTVLGYMNIENETNYDEAKEEVLNIINEVFEHFGSYDEIINEIDRKHNKYIKNAVDRARFLLLNSNNMESKLSAILQVLSIKFNEEEENNLYEDVSDDVCKIFNIFPQNYLSNESLYTVPISRKIRNIEEIISDLNLNDKEKEELRLAANEKNKNRFSRKNITIYLNEIMGDKDYIMASDLPIDSKRDMIRLIFINLYGRSKISTYNVVQQGNYINNNGFSFNDFKIEKRKQ